MNDLIFISEIHKRVRVLASPQLRHMGNLNCLFDSLINKLTEVSIHKLVNGIIAMKGTTQIGLVTGPIDSG